MGTLGLRWKLTKKQIAKRKVRQLGAGNNGWKGGRIERGGYVLLRIDQKYLMEHRVNMERAIGRPLKAKEVVHHWDENRKNNSIENLALLRHKSAHGRLHEFARRHNLPVEALKFEQSWLVTA